MLNRLAVFARKMERHLYALVQRTDGGVLLDQHIHLILDDLAQQGGDILVVVVEGVAVDPAVLHDAAHADLAQRLLVQQLEKRVFDPLSRRGGRFCLLSAFIIARRQGGCQEFFAHPAGGLRPLFEAASLS